MEREQFLKYAVQRIITEFLRHLHDGKCLEYVAHRVEYCSTLFSQPLNSTYSFDVIIHPVDHGFKVQLIAEMLNVSKRTVFRCLQEFSLSTNYNDRDVSRHMTSPGFSGIPVF